MRAATWCLGLIALTSAARADDVIVSGRGVQVTVADVERVLAQQSPRLRERYRDPAALRGLVDELVRQQLLTSEAIRRGYERDPAVLQNVKDSSAQALVLQEIEAKLTPDTVPLADVQAYYDAHPAEFHQPALRRASVIVFDAAEQAQQLLAEAQKADARQFAELARQHSRDAQSKVQGGDVGYFAREPAPGDTPPELPASVRAAAFALDEIGDTSAPVPYGKQFALVRLSGLRPEREVTLAEATPSIRTKLWRERRQKALDALVGELRARQKPQLFTERIYAIDFEDMERRPSGFAPDPIAPAVKTSP